MKSQFPPFSEHQTLGLSGQPGYRQTGRQRGRWSTFLGVMGIAALTARSIGRITPPRQVREARVFFSTER